MTTPPIQHKRLSTYLNDHPAGSTAGIELAKRSASSNAGTPYGDFLAGLVQEIDGYPVEVTGNLHTIVLVAEDRKGSIARITGILAEHDEIPGHRRTVSGTIGP